MKRFFIFLLLVFAFFVLLFFIHPYIVWSVGGAIGFAGIIEILLVLIYITILVYFLSPTYKEEEDF